MFMNAQRKSPCASLSSPPRQGMVVRRGGEEVPLPCRAHTDSMLSAPSVRSVLN